MLIPDGAGQGGPAGTKVTDPRKYLPELVIPFEKVDPPHIVPEISRLTPLAVKTVCAAPEPKWTDPMFVITKR